MPKSESKIVHIKTAEVKQALSKDQKRFNSLIKSIDKLKKQLSDWREILPRIEERASSELEPLYESFEKHQLELVYLLDDAFGNKLFKNKEKKKISHLICSITAEILAEKPRDDIRDNIVVLHDKHSDVTFDEISEEANDRLKFMMEDMLDIELPSDLDFDNEQDIHEFLYKKMQENKAEDEQKRQQAEEKRNQRKKTPKQLQKEAEQEAKQKVESQNIRKSIQEVYRKLVAELHPDREMDGAERERKTELMQRVNVAYNKKDLLKLLELQLEIEQIDQLHMNSISKERLTHYNKILKDQQDELKLEMEEAQMAYRMQFDVPPFVKLTVKDLTVQLNHDISDVKQNIKHLKSDMKKFQDPQRLKSWLKDYDITPQQNWDEFEFPYEDEFQV